MATTIGYMSIEIRTTDDVSGYPGAIRLVNWIMRWSDPDLYGDTYLDIEGESFFDLAAEALPAAEDYVAIADVTDAMLKSWIIADIPNYDDFVAHHMDLVAVKHAEYTMTTHATADHIENPNFV